MWHTAELITQVRKDVVKSFFESNHLFPEKITLSDGTEKNCWKNISQTDNGVTIWTYPVYKPDYVATCIYARVNFGKLVHCTNRVTVADEQDNTDCIAEFKALMEDNFPWLPADLDEWTLHRLDYCVNLQVGSINKANRYLQLCDKSDTTRRVHNKSQLGQSFYYGNKSYTVNVYHKLSNVLDDLNAKIADPMERKQYILDAKGIVRVELQCFPGKLNQIKRKYHLEDKHPVGFLSDSIAMETLEDMLLSTVGTAPYIKHSEALERIQHLQCPQDKKKRMQRMIDAIVNSKKSMTEVKIRLAKDKIISEQTFRKYAKELEATDINPVTIPDSWNIDYLPSLYALFEAQIING